MAPYLKPHTSQWFEALRRNNPRQATHTAAISRAAGSERVCSICGDQPARDYRLITGDPLPPRTLRLCDDCVSIRKGMYGEVFVPAAACGNAPWEVRVIVVIVVIVSLAMVSIVHPGRSGV